MTPLLTHIEELNAMIDSMSDLAKDAYGTRRACPDVEGLSYEEVSVIYDGMIDVLNENMIADQLIEKENIASFESLITNTISMGAADRETAIRWIIASEDDVYMGNDHICYEYGIPYGYLDTKAA